MIFYFFYYSLIGLLYFIDHFIKNSKAFSYIALAVVIIVSGTRYNTGYDFSNYKNFYTNSNAEKLEPLFNLSVNFLNLFSSDSQLMFFIYSFFTVGIIYFVLTKATPYVKTSFLIFLLIPGLYLNSFSILRQGLAESIFVLAAYYLIYENKRLNFWFYSALAVGFHYTAFVPTIVLFIFRRALTFNYPIIFYIIILFFSILLYNLSFANSILSLPVYKFQTYLKLEHETGFLKLITLNLFLLLFIFFKKRYIKDKSDLFLLNFLVLGVCFTNVFSDFAPATRLSYYFLIFQIILVPKLIYSWTNLKLVVLAFFLLFYSSMLTRSLLADQVSDSKFKMTPYYSYFLKD